jgi:hypothetical protein
MEERPRGKDGTERRRNWILRSQASDKQILENRIKQRGEETGSGNIEMLRHVTDVSRIRWNTEESESFSGIILDGPACTWHCAE